jgi:hypothetical protein
MAKTTTNYKKEIKLFGISIFSDTEQYYEISTEDDSSEINDEIILRERIRKLKEQDKKWWFR